MEKVVQVKQAEVKGQVQKNEAAVAKKAELTAEQKAKKNEAAKRHTEKVKNLREQAVEAAKELKQAIKDNPNVKFGAKLVAWADAVLAAPAAGGGQSFFNKVFGDNPKVGDKITLMDYMKKTLKGKADFDAYVKKWAEKGIIVKFDAGANMFESTYTIEKL